ncbi:hypothetical protein ACVBEF_20620 [Glaciimonas sp. GG7]
MLAFASPDQAARPWALLAGTSAGTVAWSVLVALSTSPRSRLLLSHAPAFVAHYHQVAKPLINPALNALTSATRQHASHDC